MASDEVPVLIVGGGPVGLATSLLCSHYGIRSLLVEQHPGTSIYSKARIINARTMEIFRQLGIERAVRAAEIPHARNGVVARSLAGEELARWPGEAVLPEGVRDWSPTWGCTSTQETFEPILLAQARLREPAQIRFNTELLSFEQRDDRVVARLLDRPSGRVWEVRARYLVGADGAHSRVREALGIRMLGEPVLAHRINILFRADLARWVGDREISACFIVNPQIDPHAPGLLIYNGGDRWRFQVYYYPDRGERPEDYTPERCQELVRTAVGVPDLALELDGIVDWSDAALVAERFGDRRAFLVGDAEHQMTPAGGFGMNVGIQDAHNLVWKLAAVLGGWAAPTLLATYDAERAPIVREITEQMARNVVTAARAASRTAPTGPAPDLFAQHGRVFGATYASPAIVPDGTVPPDVAAPVADYVPTARPGRRAPHVWLDRAGERISTLDLFDTAFVLLAGQAGRGWCEAARAVAGDLGVPLHAYTVGEGSDLGDPDASWAAAYGVEPDGAVLVRPDGYVAWRSRGASRDAEGVLADAFGRVLQRAA
ncbi:MAG TPA: FAD-dependent monooxygenase [Thermomicrobiales bacterium]|nr:FAD-dependent monooxygenase [Thermomicrobiales bacterium]